MSGSERGVVAAGAEASASGTKPDAFWAEASAASNFPTLPRGASFGFEVGGGCGLVLCGRRLERSVLATVTGFILCSLVGGEVAVCMVGGSGGCDFDRRDVCCLINSGSQILVV